mmetsp:Transcript_29935/g.45364  ORF Transcript_29935/g.45364 Transcript_29935/m.45364 type:complete len:159 (+) Transcript_29935:4792-5268(+)
MIVHKLQELKQPKPTSNVQLFTDKKKEIRLIQNLLVICEKRSECTAYYLAQTIRILLQLHLLCDNGLQKNLENLLESGTNDCILDLSIISKVWSVEGFCPSVVFLCWLSHKVPFSGYTKIIPFILCYSVLYNFYPLIFEIASTPKKSHRISRAGGYVN